MEGFASRKGEGATSSASSLQEQVVFISRSCRPSSSSEHETQSGVVIKAPSSPSSPSPPSGRQGDVSQRQVLPVGS